VQRDVAQQKILKYLPKEWIKQVVMTDGSTKSMEYGVIDFIVVKNRYGTASKIGFRNCEQGRERFQGVGLDFIWFDEEPPEDIYDECLLRLLDRGGIHYATMTPLKSRSFIYDRIYLKKDANENTEIISMSWEDNPYLNSKEIKEMERTLSPDILESRKYGRFTESSGLVFPEFSDENITEPFPVSEMNEKYIAIDPGYTNPTAVIWACRDSADNLYVVADYEVEKQTVEFHSGEIKRITGGLGWEIADTKILIDSAARQRTAGCSVSVAEQYTANDIPVDTNVNKAVFEGIMAIKSLFCNALSERKLFVFRNCVNLIKELRGYFWGDNETPKKTADHTLDALRYLIMDINRRQSGRGKTLGILGAEKQKLIRKVRRHTRVK
jgi:phage terminase large subunit-like protein